MKDALILILSSAVVTNAVIANSQGVESWIFTSRRRGEARGMSVCVGLVTVLSAFFGWIVSTYAIKPYGLDYLESLLYLFIIAVMTQVTELFVKAYFEKLAVKFGFFLPLIAGNSAVLLLLVQNGQSGAGLLSSMLKAAGTALGFGLAMLLISGAREKTDYSDIPESFRGAPTLLLTAAIIGLAFTGFTGVL